MMTTENRRSGFTIVEVVLFLAVSAVLIIAAMIAVTGKSDQAQYADAAQATKAFFERRIGQAGDGAITSEAQDCRWNGATYASGASDGSCIFLGYLFRVDPGNANRLEVIQMYGNRIASDDPCFATFGDDPLSCANPHPTPVTGAVLPVETYEIPWSMEVTEVTTNGNDVEYFGYLRDPGGQGLIPISFRQGAGGEIDNPAAYRSSHGSSFVGEEFDLSVCLDHNGKAAQVILGEDERQVAVQVVLDDAALVCP